MLLLEVVVTRGRWLQFDNGVQVSLGNRRDLTQDAQLPLSFFYAPSPMCLPYIPAFLPSVSPQRGERWLFRPRRERDEDLRYRSHICPDDVRAVNSLRLYI